MMKHALAGAAVLLATAPGAFAQSAPDFGFSGFVQGEAVYQGGLGGQSGGFAGLDLDMAIGGPGSPFGVELEARGLAFSGQLNGQVYGGGYYDTGAHRITLGAPAPAYNSFRSASVFDGFGVLEMQLNAVLLGSVVDYLQIVNGSLMPGVRYDGQFGDLALSASYHSLAAGNVQIADLAAQYSFANMAVSGGVEYAFGGASLLNYYVGLSGETASGEYSARFGFNDLIFAGQLAEINYLHNFSDRLSLGVGMVSYGDFTQNFGGVTAQYSLSDSFYARGGVFGSPGISSVMGTLAVGMTF